MLPMEKIGVHLRPRFAVRGRVMMTGQIARIGSAVAGLGLILAALVGCEGVTPPHATTPPPLPTVTPRPTPAAAPTATPPLSTVVPPTQAPTPVGEPALPPEPQRVEFQAADGQQLEGLYYPAAVNPAPAVVLMHWAPGDQRDWAAIVPWLQNRGVAVEPGSAPWLDPTWFPPMLEGVSFAVFTFNFRGCEGGCKSFDRAGWLLDAQAAMATVKTLPGVDATRIAAIGASIGADGAADACGEGCLGALSLSPGDYLTVPYADAVAAMQKADPPKPAWCLAAQGDTPSALACRAATGEHYRAFTYPGNEHGLMLLQPGMDPETMGLILDFLRLVFGIA